MNSGYHKNEGLHIDSSSKTRQRNTSRPSD